VSCHVGIVPAHAVCKLFETSHQKLNIELGNRPRLRSLGHTRTYDKPRGTCSAEHPKARQDHPAGTKIKDLAARSGNNSKTVIERTSDKVFPTVIRTQSR
jgi:hypothetical protein